MSARARIESIIVDSSEVNQVVQCSLNNDLPAGKNTEASDYNSVCLRVFSPALSSLAAIE